MENSINNNFISSIASIDYGQVHVMHSKSNNIEIMINDEANKVIKERFKLPKNSYQNSLESMKGIEFVFDQVNLLHYKCHKINPNRGGSNIDSPD